MNRDSWMAYLDTLPPDHRDLAQMIMTRIQTILNSDREHSEQRSDHNAQRISELAIRLDIYEEQRAKDVQAEIERFARDQLSIEEQEHLIELLFDVAARIEFAEDKDRRRENPNA